MVSRRAREADNGGRNSNAIFRSFGVNHDDLHRGMERGLTRRERSNHKTPSSFLASSFLTTATTTKEQTTPTPPSEGVGIFL